MFVNSLGSKPRPNKQDCRQQVIVTFAVEASESFLALTLVSSSDLLDTCSTILAWK